MKALGLGKSILGYAGRPYMSHMCPYKRQVGGESHTEEKTTEAEVGMMEPQPKEQEQPPRVEKERTAPPPIAQRVLPCRRLNFSSGTLILDFCPPEL